MFFETWLSCVSDLLLELVDFSDFHLLGKCVGVQYGRIIIKGLLLSWLTMRRIWEVKIGRCMSLALEIIRKMIFAVCKVNMLIYSVGRNNLNLNRTFSGQAIFLAIEAFDDDLGVPA